MNSLSFFFIVLSFISNLNIGFGVDGIQISIGRFENSTASKKPFDHLVRSGTVTLLNERVLEIRDFNYDGKGPYAYWSIRLRSQSQERPKEYGDYRSNPILQDPIRAINSDDKCLKPQKYSQRTIKLTLPSNYTWKQVAWVGIYCYGFKHLFNYMMIPQDKTIGLEAYKVGSYFNCNGGFGVCKSGGKQQLCYKSCTDGSNCAKDLLK